MRFRFTVISCIIVAGLCVCLCPAQESEPTPSEAFKDGIHYLRIARWDLAKSNLEYVALNGDPVEMLALSMTKEMTGSEQTLLGALTVKEVAEQAQEVLNLLERGRAAQQQDPTLIEVEIKRLGTTPRGRLLARDRLAFIYKEYAVPQLLRALADDSRASLHAHILWVLQEMGKPAVDPLTAGLASEDPVLKRHIVRTLGKLGYRRAGPYLQEVAEDPATRSEIKGDAQHALTRLQGMESSLDVPAAELFYRLANDYYYGKVSLVDLAGFDTAKVWYFDKELGVTFALVPSVVYDEIMTMRTCQRSLDLDASFEPAVSLWLSSALQMEAKLPVGERVALLGENWPGAGWFVVTAGQRYLQVVLARAEQDRNAAVALGAVKGLDQTAGPAWLSEGGRIVPLADALSFPDRRVRIAAALALAKISLDQAFVGADAVVPTLCEAVKQTGQPRAVIMEASADAANAIQADLRELGYRTVVVDDWADGLEEARQMRGPDLLVVGKDTYGSHLIDLMAKLADDYALASTPVIALVGDEGLGPATQLAAQNSYLGVLSSGAPGRAIAIKHLEILEATGQEPIGKAEADRMALFAAKLIVHIASSRQAVYNPTLASDTLIASLIDPRLELVKLALQGLSLLPFSENQQAIARYALEKKNPMHMRLIALDRLSESARLWGNQLTQEQIGTLVEQLLQGPPVGSLDDSGVSGGEMGLPPGMTAEEVQEEMDPATAQIEYHRRVAKVVGSLNLPSEIIKKLVLREKH